MAILNYKEELTKAMTLLSEDKRTIFIGQTVEYSGSAMYDSLVGVPMEKRIEVPVFEDTQMGMSIGISLMGYIPISIFPRFDFLLCAVNQLVNHLDKLEEMTHGEYHPKVIIRTQIGATKPLYPGLQHCGDYTEAFTHLLKTVKVKRLTKPDTIISDYKQALEDNLNYLFIESGDT